MKPVTRLWLIVLLGLLVWLVVAWFLGSLLGGTHPWLLRVGFALIGLLAAGFLLWYYRPAPAPSEVRLAEASVDQTLKEAQRKLRGSRAARHRFKDVPMVIVLGPGDAAKTTVVLHAGLAPELLGGSVFRGDLIAPTEGTNAWLADSSVIVEAGGPLQESPPAWNRLLRYLPAGRWRAALTGRPQSPRVALVCVSCEELLQQGASERIAVRARSLRQLLEQLSEKLRVRLPMYVLFTKLDRVPHFEEYVRTLSHDEVRDAFGALLPADMPAGSAWTETMHQRLQEELGVLYGSLANRRLLVLGRDPGSAPSAGAYEFPREFRKLFAPMTEFLLELGRPSQLQAAPFLRGVHFSGIRPVLAEQEQAAAGGGMGGGGPRTIVSTPEIRPAAGGAGHRRVPQWVFIDRFLPKVVLADEVALGVTRSGRGVHLLRRTLLAAAVVVALVFGIGMMVSTSRNRDLVQRADLAIRNAATLEASVGGRPTPASLSRLDSLRAVAAIVSRQAHGARPLGYRWGLSQAPALYPVVRGAYFRALERLLFAESYTALRASLRALPNAQDEHIDYRRAYDRLKAYLIVTRYHDKSSAEFLGPELYDAWSEGRGTIEPALATAVREQFDFLGEELPWGNPYQTSVDTAAINAGRRYLVQFGSSNRILLTMTAEASRAAPVVAYAKLVPGAAGVVTATHEVPGAFTKQGWEFMQKAFLGSIDRFLKSEPWVVGDDAAPPPDRAKLVRDLQAQYRVEYSRQWQEFLNSAAVTKFGSAAEAASKLSVLGSNQSPLLALFGIVTLNTGLPVDSVGVGQFFRAAQMMAPPYTGGAMLNATNEPYVAALVQLQAAVNFVATTTPDGRVAAAQTAQAKVGEASAAAQNLANKFPADSLQVHLAVKRLMLAPVEAVDFNLRNVGSKDVNDAAQQFCVSMRTLLGKYPFASQSQVKASMQEVAAAFEPQQGLVWTYARERLKNAVSRQGAIIVVQPGAGPPLTQDARNFFGKAAEVTDAFFRNGGQTPSLAIAIKPELDATVPQVGIEIDGRTQTFTRTSNSTKTFEWNGAQAQTMSATVGSSAGAPQTVSFRGPWALFDFFHMAELRSDGNLWHADFAKPRLSLQLNLNGAAPIFGRDYFSGWKCPSLMVQ